MPEVRINSEMFPLSCFVCISDAFQPVLNLYAVVLICLARCPCLWDVILLFILLDLIVTLKRI